MSKSRNRVVSWIVLMVFSIVIFCSSAFIIVYADHDCTGSDCLVCAQLAQCSKNLHTTGISSGKPGFFHALAIVVPAIIFLAGSAVSKNTTLITLKVELLN